MKAEEAWGLDQQLSLAAHWHPEQSFSNSPRFSLPRLPRSSSTGLHCLCSGVLGAQGVAVVFRSSPGVSDTQPGLGATALNLRLDPLADDRRAETLPGQGDTPLHRIRQSLARQVLWLLLVHWLVFRDLEGDVMGSI